MKLIVGLGNPGPRYRGTRHNVGYDVVDYLAASPRAGSFRTRFEADLAELRDDGLELLLAKPQTFMNLSGRAVRAIVDFYKLAVEEVFVVCDDIALPLGKLRARASGSHGGHNGLRNVQDQLGTDAYARLRIGVGAPGERGDDPTVDHVLGRFKPGERAAVEEAIANAARAAVIWASDGIDLCMTRVNGPPPRPKKPKPDSIGDPPPRSDPTQPEA